MDIDIDFTTEFDPQDLFPNAVPASRVENGKLLKHPAGAYLQQIPSDPITGLAAIPYKEAEERGYFKIDFLHLSVVDVFTKHLESKTELRQLCEMEPNWDLLLQESVVEKLFQIHRYHNILIKVKPQSVDELADTIAIIRPAKRMLLDSYIKGTQQQRKDMRKVLYTPPEDGTYYYKRSHAIAYAMTIVIQLHLIGMDLL